MEARPSEHDIRLLEGIQRDLLAPEVEAEVCRRAAKLEKAERPATHRGEAMAKLKAEVANLTEAIATGALRSSPALATRLQTAERELARLEAEVATPPRGSVAHMIPRFVKECVNSQ